MDTTAKQLLKTLFDNVNVTADMEDSPCTKINFWQNIAQ